MEVLRKDGSGMSDLLNKTLESQMNPLEWRKSFLVPVCKNNKNRAHESNNEIMGKSFGS